MKLTFGKIFELGLVAATKSAGELRPFIDWVQQALENLSRVLVQNVTVGDNLDAEIISFKATSATTTYTNTVKFRKQPQLVLLGKQYPTTPSILSWAWEVKDSQNIVVTVNFSAAPSAGVTLSLLAFFN